MIPAAVLAAVLFGLAGWARAPAPVQPAAPPAASPAQTGPALPSPGTQADQFFDGDLFLQGLRERQAMKRVGPAAEPKRTLAGGLVPHHNLAAANLSAFFLELEAEPPRTVIVVGPNHENLGQRVITGRYGWATSFGRVDPDLDLIGRLAEEGLATVDDQALAREHSVGALMPYLKYHAPDTRVVPLVLHSDLTLGELRRLADHLAPHLTADRLLLASVDFSHYLTRDEAEAKDRVTLDAILRRDLAAIRQMNNDYVDSPPSLILLLLLMERLGAAGPEILAHTNSGVLLGSDLIETTSYFTFAYHRK